MKYPNIDIQIRYPNKLKEEISVKIDCLCKKDWGKFEHVILISMTCGPTSSCSKCIYLHLALITNLRRYHNDINYYYESFRNPLLLNLLSFFLSFSFSFSLILSFFLYNCLCQYSLVFLWSWTTLLYNKKSRIRTRALGAPTGVSSGPLTAILRNINIHFK